MKMYKQKPDLIILLLFVNIGFGAAAPFLSWFGLGGGDSESEVDRYDTRRASHFRVFSDEHKHKQHKHTKPSHYSSKDEFETYYVKIPPAYSDHNQHVYDHSDGVDIWELPPFWNGHLSIPNLVPKKKEKDGHYQYGGDIGSNERIVKGWDNRWGFRLAIPYIGDFQYLREMGPGDFVPKLGPGKFEYPGPGEVDDLGHKGYDPYEGFEEPKPQVPVIDLTEYHGLQNYPWYTR